MVYVFFIRWYIYIWPWVIVAGGMPLPYNRFHSGLLVIAFRIMTAKRRFPCWRCRVFGTNAKRAPSELLIHNQQLTGYNDWERQVVTASSDRLPRLCGCDKCCVATWLLGNGEGKVGFRLLWWFSGKESTCETGDAGSIPGFERYPGEGNGTLPQYSCLGNPMEREARLAIVHRVAKNQACFSD